MKKSRKYTADVLTRSLFSQIPLVVGERERRVPKPHERFWVWLMSACSAPSAVTTAAAPTAGCSDEQLVAAIQRRLQGDAGFPPKKEYVAIAIALAQDEALVPGTVCKAATPPITSSGTRKRIVGYRERILGEGLLTACAEYTAVDPTTAALELEAERRAKKTKQRHDQREHWAELNAAIDAMIGDVEVQHERDQRALWRCPGGCSTGSNGTSVLNLIDINHVLILQCECIE